MAAEVHIVGKSRHVEKLRKTIAQLSRGREDVLITGEAGVGKSLVASLIALGDSVSTVDLALLDESRVDSLLSDLKQGTVVFERLGESSFRTQDAILEFLRRKAGDVRAIVTLNKFTKDLLVQGKLTENLCARINTFAQVEVLSLRDRPEDIPVLVKHFANGLTIDINTLETLINLPWNENIRQLKSVVERCVSASADGRFVLPEDLVDERTEVAKMVGGLMERQKPVLEKSLDAMENAIIRRTLERFGFDESKAARFLGMTEHAFGLKLKRLVATKATAP